MAQIPCVLASEPETHEIAQASATQPKESAGFTLQHPLYAEHDSAVVM